MQRSEILSIRLEQFDLTCNGGSFAQAKAGAREQPITKNLAEYLLPYQNAAMSDGRNTPSGMW